MPAPAFLAAAILLLGAVLAMAVAALVGTSWEVRAERLVRPALALLLALAFVLLVVAILGGPV